LVDIATTNRFDGAALRRLLSGPAGALGLRASGAVLNIVTFAFAAWTMSAGEFGLLAMWFSTLSILAMAATLGQDTLIARSWAEYRAAGDMPLACAAYRHGWTATLLGVGAGAAVVAVGGRLLDLAPEAIAAAALFLAAQAALNYSSSATRVIAGFLVSEVHREISWRVALLFLTAAAALAGRASATGFLLSATAGMALALFLQSRGVARALPPGIAPATATPRRDWFARARAMWVSATIEAASQHADVMVIGAVVAPAVAGDYFLAARIAGVFLMLTSGLGAYAATHGPNLYYAGKRDELQALFRAIMRVAFLVAAPALLSVLFLGPGLLALFGPRAAQIYPTLATLSIATFIMAMCGLAPGLLLLSGLEGLYSKIAAAAIAGRIAASAILATFLGSLGAALGWLCVSAPVAILFVVLARRLRGVDPSALSLLAARR
jgi:O-antigen/teichoic acid export membrane protein